MNIKYNKWAVLSTSLAIAMITLWLIIWTDLPFYPNCFWVLPLQFFANVILAKYFGKKFA